MRVSTILTLDRMDFDAIFQQVNLNLSRKLYALTLGLQKFMAKTALPESYACLLDPQQNFQQSFASRVLKNVLTEIFTATANIFSLYKRGLLVCLLGFWPSGPKPFVGNYYYHYFIFLFFSYFTLWSPEIRDFWRPKLNSTFALGNDRKFKCTGVTGLHDSLARVLAFQFCNFAFTSISLIDRPLLLHDGLVFCRFLWAMVVALLNASFSWGFVLSSSLLGGIL